MLSLSFILVFVGILVTYKEKVIYYYNQFFAPNKNVSLNEKNEYYRDYDFEFVQNTNNFTPMSENDILNIYYTAINAGVDEFTFYCVRDYPDCVNQIKALAMDQEKLSDINNFVHPFNQFSHIETEYDSLGKITISVDKSYTKEEIDLINTEVDRLYNQIVNPNASVRDNIKSVHDYIINHARYDSNRSDYGDKSHQSNIAYGPLFEGWAVCGGYSDLMQLFLEKLGVKNFKVSSAKHVWNAVFYDNMWLNLDLTWDDPVSSDGKDYLEHNYFLIDTETLLENDTTEHIFNQEHYSELKVY